jgi:endonuclease YncB( thermonuclease family)
MAGESARESARRQREKAARLQRSAELWERGAEGEQATAAALDALPKDTWTVFHDVHWPGRTYANIDHVAVGPSGVFVIDSKNWAGTIAVRDNVLRQNGRAREKTVAGAAEAALAIASLTPVVIPQHVLPVLCFVRDEALTGWARDVMVCSTANLVEMLTSRPEVLPPPIAREASLQLDAMVRSATAPAAPAAPAARTAPRATATPRPTVPQTAPRQLIHGLTARAPASRSSSKRRRKNPGASLVKLVLMLAFGVALITTPQLLTSLSQGFAELLTSRLLEESPPEGRPADGPPPRSQRAVVVRHVDGDTLLLRAADDGSKVLSNHDTRVRLLEIDTPESVTPDQPVECYGKAASAELKRLTPVGSIVRVLPDRDLRDPYGRTLLYVWNAGGEFVNLQLVRSGAARAVLFEPNDRYIAQMRRAETKARANDRGQWGAC